MSDQSTELWTPRDAVEGQEEVRHIHAGDEGAGGDVMGSPPEDPTGYPNIDGVPGAPPLDDFMTCFLVLVDMDGNSSAFSDVTDMLQNKRFVREATLNDMWRAAAEIQRDVESVGVTQRVVGGMQQIGQQMAEQQRSQQVAEALARKGFRPDGSAVRP